MRNFNHWTASYIFSRSRDIGWRLVHPGRPWLTPTAIRLLEDWLKPAHTVFEWGAGRSTLWFAWRVRNVISIEHDAAWSHKIRSAVLRLELNNVQILFIPDSQDTSSQQSYVDAIYRVTGQCDLIVVDGIHRGLCALAALDKVKPGGLLLVDNANWYLPSSTKAPASRTHEQGPASKEWAEFQSQISCWTRLWTSNGVFDTAIWIRPDLSRESHEQLSKTARRGSRIDREFLIHSR